MSWLSQTFHQITGRNLSDVTGIGGHNNPLPTSTAPIGPGDARAGGPLLPGPQRDAPKPHSETVTIVAVVAVLGIALFLAMRSS